uniref:Deoxycytidylate deaminase n=1 Tax=Sparus aurata TaxID=8175 RepID=A0A671XCK3_SPAAU
SYNGYCQCLSQVDFTWAGLQRIFEDYLEKEYFMTLAKVAAQRSKDPNTQVGACIVNQEKKIVGIGYNSMPNGCDGQLTWTGSEDGFDWPDTKYPYVCHAELNAIMNKNSADVKGCTIYVTLLPCNECAKLTIQAGISKVIYLSDKYNDTAVMAASRRLLDTAHIPYELKLNFDSINPSGMRNNAAAERDEEAEED